MQDANFNCQFEYVGTTPLHHKASIGNATEIADLLQSESIDVNLVGSTGATPLSQAVSTNNMATARALLAHPDIDVNKSTHEACWGPLHFAIMYSLGDSMAKLLIDDPRTDVNAVDKFGRSLLQVAVVHGKVDIIRLDSLTYAYSIHGCFNSYTYRLLLGRDDLVIEHRDVLGDTPRDVALRNGRNDIVQLIDQRQIKA